MMAVFYRKSRFTLLDSGHFWLSETPSVPGSVGPDFRCERMATWLELRDSSSVTPDGSLLFINTHLDHGSNSSRDFGAGVIMDHLTTRLPQNIPVVLTGDMNAHEDSDAIAMLCSGSAGTARLMDTFREAHPSPTEMESTSHGWFKPRSPAIVAKYGDRPAPPFGQRIDYILTSRSCFTVIEAAIDRYEDTLASTSKGSGIGEDGSGRFGRGRFPSDHFAVVTTLHYKSKPAWPAL
jgi:endonuclease/exonuclease/phosphatase family metal-dependent hydrolase